MASTTDVEHGRSGRNTKSALASADIYAFILKCTECVDSMKDLRSKGAVPVALAPLDSTGDTVDMKSVHARLERIVMEYGSILPPLVWIDAVLNLGDTLAAIGEYRVASALCYRSCLQSPEPQEGDATPPHTLAVHVRALLGLVMCAASAARMRDAQMEAVATLSQLLLCLQRVQHGMQLLLSARARTTKETLYYLVHNGAVCTLALAEPMLTFQAEAARRVLPYLNWCLLAVEATPHLAAPRYLPLRIRLYGAVCRAYERQGMLALPLSIDTLPAMDDDSIAAHGPVSEHLYGARAAIGRALKTVSALHRMYSADPPLVEETMALIDAARVELAVRKFVYDSRVALSAAAAALVKDVAAQGARLVAVVASLSWSHGQARRVLHHAPPGQEVHKVLHDAQAEEEMHMVAKETVASFTDTERARVLSLLSLLMKELGPFLHAALPLLTAWAQGEVNKVQRVYGKVSALRGSSTRSSLQLSSTEMGGDGPSYQLLAYELERSAAGKAFPLSLHCAALRACFSYEAWPEFVYLLHAAEARLDAMRNPLPVSPSRRRSSIVQGEEKKGEEEGGVGGQARMSPQELAVCGHEVVLLRRMYELEFGIMPVPTAIPQAPKSDPSPAPSSHPPASSSKGAPATASKGTGGTKSSPAPTAAKAAAPASAAPVTQVESVSPGPTLSLSPLAHALASGLPPSQPLPHIAVTPVQLAAAAEALKACTRLYTQSSGSAPQPLGGLSLSATRTDMVRDACVILSHHASGLQAWRDSRDVGQERDKARKSAVLESLITLYQSIHSAAQHASLDDPCLRAEVGMRLALALAETDDVIQAVQVIRRTLRDVTAARDRQVEYTARAPLYGVGDGDSGGGQQEQGRAGLMDDEDVIGITHASVTATMPPRELVEALREPDSEPAALTRKHAWGARSMAWLEQTRLAAWHADVVSTWATLELRYGAWQARQAAVMAAKRARIEAAKKTVSETRKRPKLRTGSSADKSGGRGGGPGRRASLGGQGEELEEEQQGPGGTTVPKGTAADEEEYTELLLAAIAAQGPSFKGWQPSTAHVDALLMECKRNSAWKACVYLALVHWKYDAAGRMEALQAAYAAVRDAEAYERSLFRHTVTRAGAGVTWTQPEAAASMNGAGSSSTAMGTTMAGGGSSSATATLSAMPRSSSPVQQALDRSMSRGRAGTAKGQQLPKGVKGDTTIVLDTVEGRTRIIDPSSGLVKAVAGENAYPAPLMYSRSSSSITLAPCAYPGSQGGAPVHISRTQPPAPVQQYMLFGKAHGSGGEVMASHTGLPGTGQPCHAVGPLQGGFMNDVWATTAQVQGYATRAVYLPSGAGVQAAAAPSVAELDSVYLDLPRQAACTLSTSLTVTVTDLTPNEAYQFASGAYSARGHMAGDSLSMTTLPIIAATPLPLHLLHGYIALEAGRIGERALAREAALAVVKPYVSMSPQRPIIAQTGATGVTTTLRRELVILAPPPVQAMLARCLLFLAESSPWGIGTEEGEERRGAQMVDSLAAHPEAAAHMLHPPVVYDRDGWGWDSIEEGRAEEGPGSLDEGTALTTVPGMSKMQLGCLQRVHTAALAVESSLSCRDPSLVQSSACVLLTAATPLLTMAGGQAPWMLLQPMTAAVQALRSLPITSLHPPAQRALTRLTYELSLCCLSGGPVHPPAAGIPTSTLDTLYARAVLGEQDGEASSRGSEERRQPSLPDLSRIAPGWVHPAPMTTQPYRAWRDYSAWTVEAARDKDIVPAAALADAYGFYPGPYGGFRSDDVTLRLGYDGTSWADKCALASALLWSPAWVQLLEGNGVGLSSVRPGAKAPALTDAPAAVDTAALLHALRTVCGFPSSSMDPSSPSDGNPALAKLLAQQDGMLQAAVDVWSAARAGNGDCTSAVLLLCRKYALVGRPLESEPAPAPGPAQAGGAPRPPTTGAKAGAKGDKGAASPAPVVPVLASPPSLPSTHPAFGTLLLHLLTAAMATRPEVGSAATQDRAAAGQGAPSVGEQLTRAAPVLDSLLSHYLSYAMGKEVSLTGSHEAGGAGGGGACTGAQQGASSTPAGKTKPAAVAAPAPAASTEVKVPTPFPPFTPSPDPTKTAWQQMLALSMVYTTTTTAASGSPSSPFKAGEVAPLLAGVHGAAPFVGTLLSALRPALVSSCAASVGEDMERGRLVSFLVDILALQHVDSLQAVREEQEEDGIMGSLHADSSAYTGMEGNHMDGAQTPPTSARGGTRRRRLSMGLQPPLGSLAGGEAAHVATELLHRDVRPISSSASLLAKLGLSPTWHALKMGDKGLLPPHHARAALLMASADLLRARALLARLQAVAAAQSTLEAGFAAADAGAAHTPLKWRAAPPPGESSSAGHGAAVYAGEGPYSHYTHLLHLLADPGTDAAWAKAIPQVSYVPTVEPPSLRTAPLCSVLPCAALVLSATSDAAIAARACGAWATALAAGSVAWAAIGAAWAAPSSFGAQEPAQLPEAEIESDGVGAGEHATGLAEEEAEGQEQAWRVVPPVRKVHIPALPASLDWRPLWRTCLCLLDTLEAIGQRKVQRVYGQGYAPGVAFQAEAGSMGPAPMGGDSDSQADMLDSTARDPLVMSMGGTLSLTLTATHQGGKAALPALLDPGAVVAQAKKQAASALDEEEDAASAAAGEEGGEEIELPPGVARDDVCVAARLLAYTALALLHAQEWAVLAAVGARIQAVYPSILRILGGPDAISQSPHPSSPDLGWSGLGARAWTGTGDMAASERGAAKSEPLAFKYYPGHYHHAAADILRTSSLALVQLRDGHGAPLADDCLLVAFRAAGYAARVRWTEAEAVCVQLVEQYKAAQAAFDTRPSLAMKMQKKRTAILEQQSVLNEEEQTWATNVSIYTARIAVAGQILTARAKDYARLSLWVSRHSERMGIARRALTSARSALSRYAHYSTAQAGEAALSWAAQALLPAGLAMAAEGMDDGSTAGGRGGVGLVRALRAGSARSARGGPPPEEQGGMGDSFALAVGRTRSSSPDRAHTALTPSFNSVLSTYRSCLSTLRTRRETALLAQACQEVGQLHWMKAMQVVQEGRDPQEACEYVQHAFTAWKDGLDACFGVVDMHKQWRQVLAALSPIQGQAGVSNNKEARAGQQSNADWAQQGAAVFERLGLVGCLLASIFCTRMAGASQCAKALSVAAAAAEAQLPAHRRAPPPQLPANVVNAATLSQAAILDLHLLAASCISSTFTPCAPLLHPLCSWEYSRHRPRVWLPGVHVFADERLVSATALVACCRSVANTLLEYGSLYAELSLPSIVALEHVYGQYMPGDVGGWVDASCMRGRAQVALGDIEGAADTLSALMRGDMPGAATGAIPIRPSVPGQMSPTTGTAPGAATPGPTPAPGAAQGSEAAFQQPLSAPLTLPRFSNHLPPNHPLNRAAMSWLATPHACSLAAPLAALCSREVQAKVHLLRADVCKAILVATRCIRAHADYFHDLGYTPSTSKPTSWYEAAARLMRPALLNPGSLPDVLNTPPQDIGRGKYAPLPVGAGCTTAQLRWPVATSAPAASTGKAGEGSKGGKGGKEVPPAQTGGTPSGSGEGEAYLSAEDAAVAASDTSWLDAVLAGARLCVSSALACVQGPALLSADLSTYGLPLAPDTRTGHTAATTPAPAVDKGAKAGSAGSKTKPASTVPAEAPAAAVPVPTLLPGEADDPFLLTTAGQALRLAAELAHARGELRVAAGTAAEAIRLLSKAAESHTSALPTAFFRAGESRYPVHAGHPSWLSLRALAGESLLGSGAVGEAEEVLRLALHEAASAGDAVFTDRLLFLRAVSLVLVGEHAQAFACLVQVLTPAAETLRSDPLTSLDTMVYASSRVAPLHSLPDPLTVAQCLSLVVHLRRSLGTFAHMEGVLTAMQGAEGSQATPLLALIVGADSVPGMSDAAVESRLLLLAERLIRQRLGAMGMDTRSIERAADQVMRVDAAPEDVTTPCLPRAGCDSLYIPGTESLAEIRDMLGDCLVSSSMSHSLRAQVAQASGHSEQQACLSLLTLAARKRAQQLVVCHRLAAAQPSMLLCASLGLARATRLWLVHATRVGSMGAQAQHTVPAPAVEQQLLMSAEMHAIVAFEMSRVLCEHDPSLLRHCAVELTRLYVLCARRMLVNKEQGGQGVPAGAGAVPAQVGKDSSKAVRYVFLMHSLAAKLGLMAQRAATGRQHAGVARFAAAAAAAGAAPGGKGGKEVEKESPDATVKGSLPPGLWEDVLAYRRAADASQAATTAAAAAPPGAAVQDLAVASKSPRSDPPVPVLSLLISHMTALHGMLRAIPSPSGPLAPMVEDACQSLHTALCTLMPAFRQQWGMAEPLPSQMAGLDSATPLSVSVDCYGPSSLRVQGGELAARYAGLTASIVGRDDEDEDGDEATDCCVQLLLGPVGAGAGAEDGAAGVGSTTRPPSSKGKDKAAAAAAAAPVQPKVAGAALDAIYLKLPVASVQLHAVRALFAGLRARIRQLLEPAAASSLAAVNVPVAPAATAVGAAGTTPASGSGGAHSEWSGGDVILGRTLEERACLAGVQQAAQQLAHILVGALPAWLQTRHGEHVPVPDLVAAVKSSMAPAPAAPVPSGGGASAKKGSTPAAPVKGQADALSVGDAEEEAGLVTTHPTLTAALRACDALSSLLDHRYGGATVQAGVNVWLREALALDTQEVQGQ